MTKSAETQGHKQGKGKTNRPASTARAAEARPAARAHPRSDDGNAFIPDPGEGPARTGVNLAEVLAEDYLEAATGGNEVYVEDVDRVWADEIGGPFVITKASQEFADDVDESNPPDARREALPRPIAGLVQNPGVRPAGGGDEDEDEAGAEQDYNGEVDYPQR
jgi:hypothetical protein